MYYFSTIPISLVIYGLYSLSYVMRVPEGWVRVHHGLEYQEYVFQRMTDGLIVSVESDLTEDDFAVVFLPRNFMDHNAVIQEFGDEGYLYSGDSLSDAIEEAKIWMEDNPVGEDAYDNLEEIDFGTGDER